MQAVFKVSSFTHFNDTMGHPIHGVAMSTCSASRGSVAPSGFCNRGEVRYGSIGGLEYEVPQSRLYCLCTYNERLKDIVKAWHDITIDMAFLIAMMT